MTYATRDSILARLRLAERDEESIPLAGTVRLRELTRAELRAASDWATSTDLAKREEARGVLLAGAVQAALGEDADQEALRRALMAYYLGTPETATDADRWNAAIVAAGVLGEDGAPLFRKEEIIQWPGRGALWDEVLRLAQAVLDLSGVGSAALKSSDLETPAE